MSLQSKFNHLSKIKTKAHHFVTSRADVWTKNVSDVILLLTLRVTAVLRTEMI